MFPRVLGLHTTRHYLKTDLLGFPSAGTSESRVGPHVGDTPLVLMRPGQRGSLQSRKGRTENVDLCGWVPGRAALGTPEPRQDEARQQEEGRASIAGTGGSGGLPCDPALLHKCQHGSCGRGQCGRRVGTCRRSPLASSLITRLLALQECAV